MKNMILAIGAAAMCSAGALAATHTPVTITGCVHAGTAPDTYVLLDVDEVSGDRAVPAGAVYWLSSTKGLKGEEKIALENGMKRAEIKEELRAVGTAGVVATEVKRPYRRLEVQRVRMIGESCVAP